MNPFITLHQPKPKVKITIRQLSLREIGMEQKKKDDLRLRIFKERYFDDLGLDGLDSNLALFCYIVSFFLAVIAVNCFCIILSKWL